MMKFSPSSSRNPAPNPTGAPVNESDDDDDLEILPPKQSRAVRQLVNLSGLGSLSKAEIDKRRNNQKLAVDVMEKQREQILRDRREKEEMIKKIRGEVLAEMKKSKHGDAEDEEFERERLFEVARREAELIRKRELEAEKKKVEAVEIPSEDEEIQIDFDEEMQEDAEDDELVVPFDQDIGDFSEDEREDNDDSEAENPEATIQDTKSFRRRPQVIDDEEDDNEENPFASQATQSNPDISMTQMFQQTQAASSNSQQLKIGDFSSDEDDEEVIPATQLQSSTTNANNDADGSLQDESFEFRSQKKVNFDFDTDVVPTQLSQFPEPTQVNMVKRPDMMDIVEGLRRPDGKKPGLRRKNRLDDNDTYDGAATQADIGSSITQAVPDSTRPIELNDTTQKVSGTVPDATQKVVGTASDTQAIPFFETQMAPESFDQLNAAKATAKEDDSADENDEQRIYIRRHRQPKLTKKSRDTGAGRELADEEAVESEDEWAGMGGNSDDEIDPEMAEELKQMVDDDESSINQSKDAAALQKLFATKKRNEDQEMEGRLQDVITGDWRKKKAKGGLLDLSDDDEEIVFGEDDDIETQKYKRRLKKAMERRKRKLLENDKLAAMKNDPKKQSFMKIIEGENSFMDTKKYFADADSSDDELEIVETQEATQEEVSSKPASAESSMAMPPPALPKRAGSVAAIITGQPPAKKRRSEIEYIRQTLSFLDEDKSDGFENEDDEGLGGGAWDPSRTLGDAIDPEQLISDDEDGDAMFIQEEPLLGEPSAVQYRSARVVNLIQERRSLTISSMTSSGGASAIEILDDDVQNSATVAGDDDEDEVIFKCTKFHSSSTSITRARHHETNKGFADVVVGSMLAGVGSKSSINYNKRRLAGGAGPGSEAADAAQNRVTRMRFEAVDKVIALRKQSSVLLSRKSGGSWMEE
jgi:mediator of replication checkpoint protein 1